MLSRHHAMKAFRSSFKFTTDKLYGEGKIEWSSQASSRTVGGISENHRRSWRDQAAANDAAAAG
jgi:hypothetical protein